MTKRIKIGIPRAFLYYKYRYLWETFFKNLDCDIVLSPETNKYILTKGTDYSIDESCLSAKIYMGHVYSLVGHADYILIPRICSYGKKEMVCTKFNAMYDIVNNTFDDIKILDYNVDVLKRKYPLIGFIKMGLILQKKLGDILKAYYKAIKMHKYMEEYYIKKQEEIMASDGRIKVLMISHPYNIHDRLIGTPILEYLKKLDVVPILAEHAPKKEIKSSALKISPKLYWTYSKELVGSIEVYKKEIDGIIYFSTFPCGPDSLVNELCLRKVKEIPCCNIVIDELQSEIGMQTRLESFIDIIKEKKKREYYG